MQPKIFITVLIGLMPVLMQAQEKEPLSITQLPAVKMVKSLFKGKVKADYIFTASPAEAGKLPKNSKTSFTTSEPVYAVIKYDKPLNEWNYKNNENGFNIPTELYVDNKKIGEAVTFFTTNEYAYMAEEKIIPLEIIPGENTWQYNSKYIDLLENIAALEPGIITIKIKGSYAKNNADVTFILDASNIAKDKNRIMRIADRIRNNKNDMKEVIRQHESNLWALPEPATRNAKLENEIKAALKSYSGINATHVVLRYTDWAVHTNSNTGIPTIRKMSIAYAWKEKGECWINYNDIYCDYLGGGKYSKIKFENILKNHLIDCERLKQ